MTEVLPQGTREPDFSRYRAQWETALMAQTIGEVASLDASERKEILRAWLQGVYNGASFAAGSELTSSGNLDWRAAGPSQFDLIYRSSYGFACSLGRAYRQPDGTWAALVIAGVKDDLPAAMAAAEWAVARLSS